MGLNEKVPNQLLYLTFMTAEEIVGKNGLKTILNYSGLQRFVDNYPPDNLELGVYNKDFIQFLTGVIGVFGEKGARPILFRGGMRSFEIMKEQFPSLYAMEGIDKLDRTPEKLFGELKRIYQLIVDASVYIHGDIYKYYESEEGLILEISPCHWCLDLKTQNPICFVQTGFQQGLAREIFGQTVTIEETSCIAVGDPMCKFVIHRPSK
jgi:predicted hydrocarbon binding protein